MLMRAIRAATLAIPLAAAAAPVLAATPAAAPKAVGPAQNCVFLANIQQSRVVDDRTIDFVMKDGRVLRNSLPNTCPGLKLNRSFGYKTSQSQLCNVDIITVVVQGAGPRKGASCGLGDFTPIELPPKN
jgi:hypothetical protein